MINNIHIILYCHKAVLYLQCAPAKKKKKSYICVG